MARRRNGCGCVVVGLCAEEGPKLRLRGRSSGVRWVQQHWAATTSQHWAHPSRRFQSSSHHHHPTHPATDAGHGQPGLLSHAQWYTGELEGGEGGAGLFAALVVAYAVLDLGQRCGRAWFQGFTSYRCRQQQLWNCCSPPPCRCSWSTHSRCSHTLLTSDDSPTVKSSPCQLQTGVAALPGGRLPLKAGQQLGQPEPAAAGAAAPAMPRMTLMPFSTVPCPCLSSPPCSSVTR